MSLQTQATQAHESARAVVEATPSAAVVAATVAGYQMSDITAALGGLFLLLQICYLVWRWRRDIAREAARKDASADQIPESEG